MTGVKTGYVHDWTYKGHWQERKIKPGVWKINFEATKGKKHSKMGTLKPGTKITWKFKNMKQTAIKIGKGKYQTRLTGYKYLAKIKPRRNKRRYK